MAIKPVDMVLRCYGQQKKDGNWYGVCLELNLAAEAKDPEELKNKLKDVIISYFETVFDTEDQDSIPELLFRRAPFKDWLIYYYLKLLFSINKFNRSITFKELL